MLLAYAKLTLYSELLDTSVPDDPYLGRELGRYFPKEMSERFDEALHAHRLRREIIATQLTNSMINRGGATLIVRIADQTGARAGGDCRGVCRRAQQLRPDRAQRRDRCARQQGLRRPSSRFMPPCRICCSTGIVWFLRNVDLKQGLDTIVAHYRDGIAQVAAALDDCAVEGGSGRARGARGGARQEPACRTALARRIANLAALKAAPDIVLVADRRQQPVAEVAATYFATDAFFQLDRVAGAVSSIAVADYFDRLALDRALDSIGDAERRLTAAMVGNGATGAGAVEEWVKPRQAEVERIRAAIHEIAGSGLTLSKLSVAASLLGDLARE